MSERMSDERLAEISKLYDASHLWGELLQSLEAEREHLNEVVMPAAKGEVKWRDDRIEELQAEVIDLKDEWADSEFELAEYIDIKYPYLQDQIAKLKTIIKQVKEKKAQFLALAKLHNATLDPFNAGMSTGVKFAADELEALLPEEKK